MSSNNEKGNYTDNNSQPPPTNINPINHSLNNDPLQPTQGKSNKNQLKIKKEEEANEVKREDDGGEEKSTTNNNNTTTTTTKNNNPIIPTQQAQYPHPRQTAPKTEEVKMEEAVKVKEEAKVKKEEGVDDDNNHTRCDRCGHLIDNIDAHNQRHQNYDNNLGQYQCQICQIAFVRHVGLEKHWIKAHNLLSLPLDVMIITNDYLNNVWLSMKKEEVGRVKMEGGVGWWWW